MINVNMNTKLLALSWKEPFATLMLQGKIETRVWKTDYRGLVLICTSKKKYNNQEVLNITGPEQYQRIIDAIAGKEMKHGYAIAIGELVHCRKMIKEDEDKCFVKYHPDLWCHIYENVYPIFPIEWKGTQGWKTVSDEIKKQIAVITNCKVEF